MKFFDKLNASKEVKAALGILDEASCTFDNPAFQMVRDQIEKIIMSRPDEFTNLVKKGTSPRQWVYSIIANITGDLVESGKYHLTRGVLNPVGPGEDLLRLFDAAVDELVGANTIDDKNAKEQKSAIRENIKSVG